MLALARWLVLGLATALPAVAQQAVDVRFVDGQGQPRAGVRVQASRTGRLLATSDARGLVTFTANRGVERVETSCPGVGDAVLDVSRGLTGDVVLADAATLTGRILDRRGDQWKGSWELSVSPPEGARPESQPVRHTVQLEGGEFRLEGVPSGAIEVWVECLREPTKQGVKLDPGGERFVDLVATGVLTLQLIEQGDFFWSQGVVELRRGDEVVARSTEVQGRTNFPSVDSGSYAMHVEVPGYEPLEVPCLVEEFTTLVDGHLRGADRIVLQPTPEFAALVRSAGWAALPQNIARFELPVPEDLALPVVAGSTSLVLFLPDGRLLTAELEVLPGVPSIVPVDLSVFESRVLRVRGPDGLPVANLGFDVGRVPVEGEVWHSLFVPAAVTDDEGWLRTTALPTAASLPLEVDWCGVHLEIDPLGPEVREVRLPATAQVEVTLEGEARLDEIQLHCTPPGAAATIRVPRLPFRTTVFAGPVSVRARREGFPALPLRTLAARDLAPGESATLQLEPDAIQAAHCKVVALVDGVYVSSGSVRLHAPEGWVGVWEDFPCHEKSDLYRSVFLPPGVTRLRVAGVDGTWATVTELDVPLRGSLLRKVDVDRVIREVRFLDGDGAPLAQQSIPFRRRLHDLELTGAVRTDEEGRMEVAMMPGAVTFVGSEGAEVVVEWGRSTEPLELRLR